MTDRKRSTKIRQPANKPADSGSELDVSGANAELAAALLGVVQAAGLTATDTQHKTDVNVPELMTSLNGLVLAQAVKYSQTIDAINANTVAFNQEFNATIGQMMIDHRDQNHDRQINVDEVAALVSILIGRIASTQNNPIPTDGQQ